MIKEAMLYHHLDEGRVECALCAHHCQVAPGKFGVCGVRENRDQKLVTHVYGEVIAAHVDPIEKNPSIIFCQARRLFLSPPRAAIFAALFARTGRFRR